MAEKIMKPLISEKEIKMYLQKIYEDLQGYVDHDVCLCKLKSLNYKAGSFPDYGDVNIQQLYLLRYAFAYAFEYSRMYLDVLAQIGDVDRLAVTSVGCGSMIDYWSLIYALKMKRKTDCRISYVGIDKIDWKYKMSPRQTDEMRCLIGNAADFFMNNSQFVSDVYFFPKSISEFSDRELYIMANSLSFKKIQKDRFFVCVSLRDDQRSISRDVKKTKYIIEAIARNGFTTKWPYTQYRYFKGDTAIVSMDPNFQYPSTALEFVKKLYTKCPNYNIQAETCQCDCQKYLSRWPILKTKHIRYQVIMFERMR